METDVWMGYLEDNLRDKRLSDIVLPGTHDSGSYCINGKSKRTDNLPDLGSCFNPIVDIVGAVWSKTQDLSIEDQLKAGIRYLDFRVYLDHDDRTLYLIHGLEGAPLYNELNRIEKFLEAHPTEIVILDMNHVYKLSEDDVDVMLQQYKSVFGDRLCPPVDAHQHVPTYSEMVSSKQTVIVALTQINQAFTHSEVKATHPWLWSSERNIVSPWANTTNPIQLKLFLQETMSKPRPSNALHVTQAILTPQMSDTLIGLVKPPRNLRQLANKIAPDLPAWFNEFSTLGLNIIITDFQNQEHINQLINLNVTGPVTQFQYDT